MINRVFTAACNDDAAHRLAHIACSSQLPHLLYTCCWKGTTLSPALGRRIGMDLKDWRCSVCAGAMTDTCNDHVDHRVARATERSAPEHIFRPIDAQTFHLSHTDFRFNLRVRVLHCEGSVSTELSMSYDFFTAPVDFIFCGRAMRQHGRASDVVELSLLDTSAHISSRNFSGGPTSAHQLAPSGEGSDPTTMRCMTVYAARDEAVTLSLHLLKHNETCWQQVAPATTCQRRMPTGTAMQQ